MSRVSFQLLGPLAVSRDGSPLVVGGPRPRLLLTRLLVARNRVVPVDTLIDDQWGDDVPRSARNTLQGYVSGMRKVLGADAPIVLDSVGYRIEVADDDAVDVRRYERLVESARLQLASDPAGALVALEEAAAMWSGPPLVEVADHAWARGEIGRIEELAAFAGELRAETLIATGREAEAIGVLEALVNADPYREQLTVLLARALYRAGRQTEALRVIDRTADRLRDDLGLTVGPTLLELQGAILRHDPALAAAPSPPRPAAAPPPRPSATTTWSGAGEQWLPYAVARRRDRVPLVGRQAELEQLDAVWQGVLAGRRALVVLEAEAGAGKTRLASEFARRIGDTGQVLWGRARAEASAPYATLADAAAGWMVLRSEPRQHDIVAKHPILGILVPELVTPEALDVARSYDSASNDRLLAEAFLDLLGPTPQPTIVVIDDVQWIGQSSLNLVTRVLRSVGADRLMILMTRRTVPAVQNQPLDRVLLDFDRDGVLTRIPIRRFTIDEVDAFLDAARVDGVGADEARRLHEITNGNAFFIEELLRHSVVTHADAAALPRTVQEAIGQRLDSLTPVARQVVELGAAFGFEFAVTDLAGLAGRGARELVEPIDEAIRNGLLRDTPTGQVGFVHALARSAVLGAMPPMRRAAAHLEIAERLEGDARSDPADIAHHLEEAGSLVPLERRQDARLARADSYLERGAAAEALVDARRLLSELDEDDPRFGAALVVEGTALRALGDGAAARAAFDRLVVVAERHDDALMLSRAVSGMFNAKNGLGLNFGVSDPKMVELAERLRDDPRLDVGRQIQMLCCIAVTRSIHEPIEAFVDLLDRADELAAGADSDDRSVVLVARRIALWTPRRFEERIETSRRAFEAAKAVGRTDLILAAELLYVADCMEAAQPVDDLLAEMRNRLERMPLSAYLAWASFLEGSVALSQGRFDDAASLATQGLAIGSGVLVPDALGAWGDLCGLLARDLGGGDEPGGIVEQLATRDVDPPFFSWSLIAALVRAERGDRELADQVLAQRMPGDDIDIVQNVIWLGCVNVLAELVATVGDARRAAIVVDALEPYRGRFGVIGPGACTGPVSHARGVAAAAAGQLETAIADLEDAIEICRQRGARPWLARSLHALAAIVDDPVRAGTLRAESEQLVTELGMAPLAEPLARR